MIIAQARIVKGAFPDAVTEDRSAAQQLAERERDRARRVAGDVLTARAEAEKIVAEAQAKAKSIADTAAADGAREAREREVAKLAASFLALREEDGRRLERDRDRLIELAVVLAERLLGEALHIDPTRIADLAVLAIQEARGARRVRIDASPEDVEPLRAALAALEQSTEVRADETLRRGSLVVHTDLGKVDARLEPQLERLAVALREALTP